jgi:hypothetical protein
LYEYGGLDILEAACKRPTSAVLPRQVACDGALKGPLAQWTAGSDPLGFHLVLLKRVKTSALHGVSMPRRDAEGGTTREQRRYTVSANDPEQQINRSL